jgi:pimeloyl-ACP methyl ester carboxylesterase
MTVVALIPDDSPTDITSMERNGVEVVIMQEAGHFLILEDIERFNQLLGEIIKNHFSYK